MNKKCYAAFAVVRLPNGMIWGTTRDGKDLGKIGLPGGKVDETDADPEAAVVREACEEGLKLIGRGKLLREIQYLNKGTLCWYEFKSAIPLSDYKEKTRGLKPVKITIEELASYGYDNEFLMETV